MSEEKSPVQSFVDGAASSSDGELPSSMLILCLSNGNSTVEVMGERNDTQDAKREPNFIINTDYFVDTNHARDSVFDSSTPSILRNSLGFFRKKLLILDINGLLADIVSPLPKEHKADINIARQASKNNIPLSPAAYYVQSS